MEQIGNLKTLWDQKGSFPNTFEHWDILFNVDFELLKAPSFCIWLLALELCIWLLALFLVGTGYLVNLC